MGGGWDYLQGVVHMAGCCAHGRVLCTWQGAVHMAPARLGCKRAMVGTEWANSSPCCMSRRRKHYSYFLGGSFLAVKVAWALSEYLPTKNADYCMLINEWAWLSARVCLLRLKVHLGSVWSQSSERYEDIVH